MNEIDNATAFGNEIDRLIDRFRDEFDLSYAEAVGVLQTKAILLALECNQVSQEEE